MEKNYRDFPNYLFAKLDYARLLMQRGDMKAVEEMFNKRWEIKLLYPDRNMFHVTEVTAFNAFMVEYRIRKGEPEDPIAHLEVMHELAPDHHDTLACAEMIRRAMFMKRLKKMSTRLVLEGLL